MKKIITLFSIIVLTFSASAEEMITREYFTVGTTRHNLSSGNLKDLFTREGVEWPANSSLKIGRMSGIITVTNTKENHEKFEKAYMKQWFCPKHIDIEVHFVEFSLADIEKISAESGNVDMESLQNLRKLGKSKLLAAPKVITLAGVEATVKGVDELIYPTEFYTDPIVENTNNASIKVGNTVVTPGGFETREIGAIASVLPEISDEGNIIKLVLSPEYVHEPIWKRYTSNYVDQKGVEREVHFEQPIFHAITVATSISLEPGETIIVGGGAPGKDEGKVVYIFVTADYVNTKGKSLGKK